MCLFELLVSIIPTAGIGTILIFYAIFLVKLRSTNEIEFESASSNYTDLSKRPKTPLARARARMKVKVKKNKKMKKDEERKAFLLFGKRDFEGCAFTFGYLRSLSKGTPIPDECLGCSKLVECFTA